MTEASLISLFVRPLNRLRIPYMVTGGVASVIYGDPRFTRDIDLVIALRPQDADRFASAWGPEDFYVPPIEVFREETMREDIYLPGTDALNAWAFEHTVIRHLDDDEVVMAPIEAVIRVESEWMRAQEFQEPA